MSKILSIDKKFVYIDDDGKFLEVKIEDLDFTPVNGASVHVHRNKAGQVEKIELLGSSKKRIKKERKAVEVRKVAPENVYVEELADDYEDLEVVIETISDEAAVVPRQKKRHFNRAIEAIIGTFTILLLGVVLGVLVGSIDVLADNLFKLAVVGGAVLFGFFYMLLALFLPKKGRFAFNTIVIIVYILILGLGVGFYFFDNALSSIINLLPFLKPIENFINNHAFLTENYPYYLAGVAILPTLLGIVYFIRGCSYLKR